MNLENVKEVSVANAHSAALRYDGTVWTWGASEFGERGNGEKGWERTALAGEPRPPARATNRLRCPGWNTSSSSPPGACATTRCSPTAKSWPGAKTRTATSGSNSRGVEEEQCYGETHARTAVPCSTVPRRVKFEGHPLTGVERIAAGGESAYAVRNGGREVLAWGENSKGQLGTGDSERHPTLTR